MPAANTQQVLKGGHVIDPASGLDTHADVVVEGWRIAAVGPDAGAAYPGAEIIDATDCLVTPGLIDIHTHCFVGLGDFCLPADRVGVHSGVPVIVDAGTAGATLIGLARQAVIDHPATRTRVFALMDPAQIYLANKTFICHQLQIAADERNIDLEAAQAVLDANRDVIVGFKVRATYTDDPDRSPFLEAAKQLAPELPIMVHLGGFPHTPVLEPATLLANLRHGDIITHAFRGGGGQLNDQGEPSRAFTECRARGVRLDVGHSGGDFHFPTARRLIDRGYLPDTISTDLNVYNVDGPVHSLSTTMSKVWALGVPLTEVIRMNTVNAATAIQKEGEYGSLAVGRSAEVSVLRIEDGSFLLSDGYNQIRANRRLRAVGCLRGGEWFEAVHDRVGELEEAV
ncbi:MAG: amidohydrolase/deacetylase family metallohydrolase [Gammaproteobacteria bacterium]